MSQVLLVTAKDEAGRLMIAQVTGLNWIALLSGDIPLQQDFCPTRIEKVEIMGAVPNSRNAFRTVLINEVSE